MHTHTHTHVCAHIHTHKHTGTHAHTHTYTHTLTHSDTHYMHMHAHVARVMGFANFSASLATLPHPTLVYTVRSFSSLRFLLTAPGSWN